MGPKGDGGAGKAAKEARAQEEARQARILQGTKSIDETFYGKKTGINPATAYTAGGTYYNADGTPFVAPTDANAQATINDLISGGKLFSGVQTTGGFGDEFYGKIRDANKAFYLPQLQDDYDDAKDQLIYNLSRTGNLHSSAGAEQMGKLARKFAEEQGRIGDEAEASVADLRSRVERDRSDLITQLNATANPDLAAQSAVARAAALATPPALSPLANAFSALTASIANSTSLNNYNNSVAVGARGSGVPLPTVGRGSVTYS